VAGGRLAGSVGVGGVVGGGRVLGGHRGCGRVSTICAFFYRGSFVFFFLVWVWEKVGFGSLGGGGGGGWWWVVVVLLVVVACWRGVGWGCGRILAFFVFLK
jgi:hypothetical protein